MQVKAKSDTQVRAYLHAISTYNKVDIQIEDSSEAEPIFEDQVGFANVAVALARKNKNAKQWVKTALGEGNATNSDLIKEYIQLADKVFKGTGDTNETLTKVNADLKEHCFLVAETLSLADVLLFCALHPTLVTIEEANLAKVADAARWADHINHILGSALPEIKLPNIEYQRVQKKQPKEKQPAAAKPVETDTRDVLSQIDIRVGKIVEVWPHPNADALYCEKIDIGNGVIKRVVTGVRNFVPQDQMQDRHVVVFANIKPSKIRGEPSEAMVFAGSDETHTKVELLDPPADTPIGTRVVCGDFVQGEPPAVDKNGKSWKAIADGHFLSINSEHLACYKNVPLTVPQGTISVKTLHDCEFH